MKIKTLSADTARYLFKIGYLRTNWDYPYWDSVKYRAITAISFWKHAKSFYYSPEQRKKLAKLTIAEQSFTGISEYP